MGPGARPHQVFCLSARTPLPGPVRIHRGIHEPSSHLAAQPAVVCGQAPAARRDPRSLRTGPDRLRLVPGRRDRRRHRVQPADAGRDLPAGRVRAGAPGHQRPIRLPSGERGPCQDHGLRGHRRRRVRRRHDLQLRDPHLGGQRLDREPAAVRGGDRGLRPRGLHRLGARRPELPGQPLRRALLRGVVVPGMEQGPLRGQGPGDAGEAHLGADRRVRRRAGRSRPGHLRDLPARPGRLGRDHGPADHRVQHVRRRLVRHGLEPHADLGRHQEGHPVLRGPGPRARAARCGHLRLRRLHHPLQPGPGGHVVRRHGHGLLGRGPGLLHGRRAQRVRPRPGHGDRGRGLALLVVAGHPRDLAAQGAGLGLHRLDDQQGLHEAGRRGDRLGARSPGEPLLDL